MRIAVMGASGIRGYLGARLALCRPALKIVDNGRLLHLIRGPEADPRPLIRGWNCT